MYIDLLVLIVVIMMVISLFVQLMPVFIVKGNLNTFANEICRQAEISGGIDSKVSNKIADMENILNLSPTVNWSTNYIEGNKVQLNEKIEVTLETNCKISLAGVTIDIPLRSKAQGRSEVYWK